MKSTGIASSLDWNFSSSDNRQSIHSLHPYPAKFIPEIPRALLEKYPPENGSRVFDPFCGSGTTLVEAQKAGFRSVGVDLNPIACLISKVKTSPLPIGLNAKAEMIANISLGLETECVADKIPNVNHWFKADIQKRIQQLRIAILSYGEEHTDALNLALSSIMVRISNQESDTRYAAIQKDVTPEKVDLLFIQAAKKVSEHAPSNKQLPDSKIIEGNILTTASSNIGDDIGLVITSPPYPNAYEYWLYHKYRMYWLDKDPQEVKKNEIGARAHYFKRNHATIDDFGQQMTSVLKLLSQSCRKNAKICFVVGRSIIHKKAYDNAELIRESAKKAGLHHLETFERKIKSQRKSFNLSHASIKTESIVILKKI